MHLRLLLTLAGSLLLHRPAPALDTAAWQHLQPFTLAAEGPVRVLLSPELLDAARPDLADLRLLGPGGEEIPFTILRHEKPPATRVTTINTAPSVEGTTTRLDLTLDATTHVARLRLVTPAPAFVKALTVETRDASGVWVPLARDQLIFRTRPGAESLSLALGGSAVRELRLTLDDTRDPPIPVTQVILEEQTAPDIEPEALPITITSVDTSTDETRLGLDLAFAHRPLTTLTLAVANPAFERNVILVARVLQGDEVTERHLAFGVIRRIALPGGASHAVLTIDAPVITPSATLELSIANGDSPPLRIEGVTAGLRPVHAAFLASGSGNYTWLAGAPDARAPRYDVQSFARAWRELPAATPVVGALTANPDHKPAQPPPIVPEIAGPFDPAGWSTRRAVTVAESGAQVLELDPAALAGARSDLGDLRLARGDRQVPFLLERSPRARALPVALVSAADPKRPRVGRWFIDLPFARIPFTHLAFTIDEPLFERRATLFELVEDARGQSYPHPLGDTTWTRHGGSDGNRFIIGLADAPATRRLILEIDHGDNQPFAPAAVEAAYRINRLRFRATAPARLELHYGNPGVSAPRYDLTLAAPQLLAARQNPARLEPAALVAQESSPGIFAPGSRGATVAFWGALALVVVVLITLVARLLPKPPDAS